MMMMIPMKYTNTYDACMTFQPFDQPRSYAVINSFCSCRLKLSLCNIWKSLTDSFQISAQYVPVWSN